MSSMQRILVFISCFIFLQFGTSQKLVEKTLLHPKTKYIQIDGSKCFQLVLKTHKSDLLKAEAFIEGEYSKDLVIKLEEDGENIGISPDFLPSFKNPNDKLSAHKVISITLFVTLPEYVTAAVHGTYTYVTAEGKYKNLSVTLSEGNCILNTILEKATIKTQTGEIVVTNAKGTVIAESVYGEIKKGPIPSGDEIYILETVEGAIIVNGNHS